MERFTVRDVVDMDVALHGRRFIVAEFVLMVAFGVGFASLELYLGLLRGPFVAYQAVTGVYGALVAINCLTFLLLARASRPPDTTLEKRSILWLTAFAVMLLLVPIAFPVTAALQRRIG